MAELTKEWLLRTIAELEEERDSMPGVVNVDAAMALAAMKLALASLEAKDKIPELRQVIYHFRDWNEGFPVERFKADYVISWMLVNYPPAQPAPVSVPDERAVELLATDLMKRIDKITGERHSVVTLSSLRVSIVEACRAAMLQGVEPVTTDNKLPAEAVYGYFAFNDHHGEVFFKKREDAIAFCKEAIEDYRQENAEEGCDPDEVRRTCWGIIMQEGTDFEVDSEGHIDYALTPELDGNSPVIPDGWVMVPVEPTYQMCEAMGLPWESPRFPDRYKAMLAAAPQQEA